MKFETTCENCLGNGGEEVMILCTKPTSQCCGGCTTPVTCEDCNGIGEVTIDTDEYLEEELVGIYSGIEDIYHKLKSYKFSHSEISSFIDKEVAKIKSNFKKED